MEATMTDIRTSTATHLRERAAYYRSLAEKSDSIGLAGELTRMADDYEADARRLVPRPRRDTATQPTRSPRR
jgi:hypothetical protein